ncbi:methyltransferase regulatory domain-containing protein [Enterobacter ludwigii]|uniref:O-linked N-acetylglucosamine transferase family protein n=1 Tax=Enterobacter ludwigii TaxID=299767 RepID=UPI000792DF2F|nr:methyltransferase regulatory domain-containing protein [Enterobacter ludwigii]MDR6399662.1 putative O-linked N-acetylglucosamine transferase (SPINDLY family)/precorrin-6B methylase 2 [Enterobacter ludwigii]WPL51641.1 methyltransferase regulatory domain-containing protein [Enterobacter ludwigii]CZU91130.1 putative SAM-dependent methyltransferases/O-linked N-acetylglucosamine transferase [Enterobacter ludwigii]
MTTQYPYYRVSPETIHAAAVLNHLTTPLPAFARVMEIGCGSATRLIMHAWAHPESIALGIDIDEEAIVKGQKFAAELGCHNVELFAAGLGDLLAADPGELDYIIIHQTFAFLGKSEREALLTWCQAHLSANGVIAIKWSVLPGSIARITLGEALRFHLDRAEEGSDLLASARAMLSFMLLTLEEGSLKNEVLLAEEMDDNALILAYLSPSDGACTLGDFNAQAELAGLQFLGDLLPQSELGSFYSPRIEQLLGAVSNGASRTLSQQYLDYAVQREERFSLLCHLNRLSPPVHPDLNLLRNLHWAGSFMPIELDSAKAPRVFRNNNGRIMRTDNAIIIRIMELLGNAWPMSLSFEQLVLNCRAPETHEDYQETVWEALKTLFMTCADGFFWSATPGAYNAAQNDELAPVGLLPPACPANDVSIMNLWGEWVSLTPAEWNYLRFEMGHAGQTNWEHYSSLKIKGLLTGSPEAWKKQLQCFLRAGMLDVLKSQLSLLLLLSVDQQQGGMLIKSNAEPVLADPDVDAIYERANSLIQKGRSKEAREYARELMEKNPDNIHVLRCYSKTCVLTSAWDDALASLCKLMGYYFSSLDIYYDLATVLQRKREFYGSRQIVRTLLRLNNKNIDYWLSLASLHHAYGDMALAEKCCREIMRFQHPGPSSLGLTGIVLSDNHKMAEARYFMEKAVELSNYNFGYFSNLLFVMSHDASVTAETLLEKHLEYGRRAATWATESGVKLVLNNSREPQRKLRLGFVSGDLRKHPVANFLLPYWDAINREQYDLVAYSTLFLEEDDTYCHLRQSATQWRQVDAISDIELAKLIAEDGIDILFDLSGHTAYNRLPVFALRPAPIQITWIGYPGTTGLKEMDYILLSASLAQSQELEKQLVENAMFVATRKSFEPHPLSPDINPLPALRNGYITFASFNRSKKINDQVLNAWASILTGYPEARLLIGNMTDAEMISAMTKRLQQRGISRDRLLFRGLVEMDEYLAMHHEIDILLDAFPYSGGTTTHHGAWMGIPTLTLNGTTIPCQQGVEIMRSYKLEEFIASDVEDYIKKAINWRDQIPKLAEIRSAMRSRISPGADYDLNCTEHFETALRKAWGIYCRGELPRKFIISQTNF